MTNYEVRRNSKILFPKPKVGGSSPLGTAKSSALRSDSDVPRAPCVTYVSGFSSKTQVARRSRDHPDPSPCRYNIPSSRGSHSDISGMYVTSTRKMSIVPSHGSTAMVSSVMPILAMPEAT